MSHSQTPSESQSISGASGYSPFDSYGSIRPSYPYQSSHSYASRHGVPATIDSNQLQLRRSMSSLHDPSEPMARQGSIYNGAPSYALPNYSRPSTLEHSNDTAYRSSYQPPPERYSSSSSMVNGVSGHRRPSLSSIASSIAPLTTDTTLRQPNVYYGDRQADSTIPHRPLSNASSYSRMRSQESLSSAQSHHSEIPYYQQHSRGYRESHAYLAPSSLQSGVPTGTNRVSDRYQSHHPAQQPPSARHLSSNDQYHSHQHQSSHPSPRSQSAFSAYKPRLYPSDKQHGPLSGTRVISNPHDVPNVDPKQPSLSNDRYSSSSKSKNSLHFNPVTTTPKPSQLISSASQSSTQPSIPLPSVMREHSKFIESILKSSLQPTNTQRSTIGDTQGLSTEPSANSQSRQTTDQTHNEDCTTPVPVHRNSPTSSPTQAWATDPSTALGNSKPLGASMTSVSAVVSNNEHAKSSSLSQHPTHTRDQESDFKSDHLAKLQSITLELYRTLSNASMQGLGAHECLLLKGKVELQQQFITHIIRSLK
ncbi:hypothetical protein QVD99_002666 [Batrachochytrium dendrobatidis]|nr:hypothetical protein QVD99_002666 [Batrachochytrium dendrobatidis]